jgi:hypothetical protein
MLVWHNFLTEKKTVSSPRCGYLNEQLLLHTHEISFLNLIIYTKEK